MANIVVFSGGRGATTIVSALARTRGAHLSVIVNTYDAGLSTGRVRRAVRGILGPSDVRKMSATLARTVPGTRRALADALETRLGRPDLGAARSEAAARAQFHAIAEGRFDDLDLQVGAAVGQLSVDDWWALRDMLSAFERHVLCTGGEFCYDDLAVGNAAMAGLFIGSDFNRAVASYQDMLGLKDHRVLNVTNGEDLWLTARAGDYVCPDEGALVAARPPAPVDDLFLLPRQVHQLLLGDKQDWFASSSSSWRALAQAEQLPDINPEAHAAVAGADIIIYGPGTQHSSLFPTYLTRGLAEAVRDNHVAEKILITNLTADKDQHPDETVADVMAKFLFFMTRRGTVQAADTELITTVLLGHDDCAPLSGALTSSIRRRTAEWSSPDGRHLGGAVKDEVSHAAGRVTRRRSVSRRHGHHHERVA